MSMSDYVNFGKGKIYYREFSPKGDVKKSDVLLLHGMRFSSETWLNLGTLQKLAEWNYRAVGIDLPGYGNSKDAILETDEATFIKDICQYLSLSKPVIISPSMSGKYSLPFLTEHSNQVGAYIPIAPVSTENFVHKFCSVKVPTLIVYGDGDTNLGTTSSNHLSKIQDHKVIKIENAGHACYLDRPDVWHKSLQKFLDDLF